jgi:hypothetical protein
MIEEQNCNESLLEFAQLQDQSTSQNKIAMYLFLNFLILKTRLLKNRAAMHLFSNLPT